MSAGLLPITRSAPSAAIMLSALGALSAHQAMRAGRPVAPIRAIGWHARAPHIVASASALEDAQQAAVAEGPVKEYIRKRIPGPTAARRWRLSVSRDKKLSGPEN